MRVRPRGPPKGPNPEDVVQSSPDSHPVSQGAMADLEILAQSVQRQERAHLLGKELGQELERREVPDRSRSRTSSPKKRSSLSFCQRRSVRADCAGTAPETAALLAPSTSCWSPRVAARAPAGRNRLRPCLRCDLRRPRTGAAVVVVPPLQRVAAAGRRRGGTAGDEEPECSRCLSNSPLEPAFQPRTCAARPGRPGPGRRAAAARMSRRYSRLSQLR